MKLKRITNRIQPNLNRKRSRIQRIAKEGYKYFKKITPIDSGNARRKTDYEDTNFGSRITANYPYAVRLDNGYSKQAKEGMSKPTVKFMKQLARKIL